MSSTPQKQLKRLWQIMKKECHFKIAPENMVVSIADLCHCYKNPNNKTQGGQTALPKEKNIWLKELLCVLMWGYPLDNFDVRYFVKGYLDKQGIAMNCCKNNMPSKEWVEFFKKK